MLFLDFANLPPDFTVGFRDPIESSHCGPGFLYTAFAICIAGRFREEQDSQAKDERPDETDAHWYSPGARVGASLGTEIDGVRGEDTRRDEELVSTHERPSHLTRSCFTGVHGYHYREGADTGTRN